METYNWRPLVRVCRVAGPTLELLVDDRGEIWRVTYNGMTREHRQHWQAMWYYHWAQALYLVDQGANRAL